MSIYAHGVELVETRGYVLSEREHNGYDDSDFFATVWMPEQGRAVEIMWGTTRGAMTCAHGFNAIVDATPEVRAQYDAWRARERRRDIAHEAALRLTDVAAIGNVVRVVKGRKVPKGTSGAIVGATKEIAHVSQYGTWTRYRTMLTIIGDTGMWKVDAANCELVAVGAKVAADAFDYAEAA